MTDEKIVLLSTDGAVARVELNRPPHNLLEGSLLDALAEAFDEAVAGGCRSILLSSRMRHFCAGADLDQMSAGAFEKVDLVGFIQYVEALPVPTVAAVHGAALGGGFELALGCDLIIAGQSAQLGLVETTLGLIPIMGGIPRVVARAGLLRAKEMVLLGRRHPAATLEQWGLITQVVADEALAEASLGLARQLAAGPTIAYAAAKRIANETAARGVRAGDDLTAEAVAPVWRSDDLKTGLEAFLTRGTADATFSGT